MDSLDQGYAENRFPAAVDEDLHCPICLNVLREPLQCQTNEHHFCTPCITRHLRNFATCPSCMEELSIEMLRKPARYLTKHLSKLNIRCEHESRGCPEFVKLEDLDTHLTICGFAPVSCSNDGCSEVINKQDRIRHETEICELRRVKCHDCAETRKEIGELKMSFEELKGQVRKMMDEMKEGFMNPKPSIHHPSLIDTKEDIIVVGGYDGVNRLDSAEMFIWSEEKWLPLPNTNEPRSASSSAMYKNQVLVVGGRTNRYILTDSIDALPIDLIDKHTSQWRQHPARLPYPCSGHSCTVYEDCLIVIGGMKGDEDEPASDCIHEVLLTPPYTTTLLSQMPQPRNLHGTTCFGDKVVIIGGTGYCYGNSVLLFDIKTNKCKSISPLPYAVNSMATVAWGDHVVIIGGQNGDGKLLNSVMMYNIKTGHTHMLPPMKHRRSSCTAVVSKNIIVVMGGFDTRQALNVVEYFSFTSYSWTELPPMNERRSSSTAVVKPGNFV